MSPATNTWISCKLFQRQVGQHLRGTLNETQQDRFDQHYNNCPSCRLALITYVPSEEEEDKERTDTNNRLKYFEAQARVTVHRW